VRDARAAGVAIVTIPGPSAVIAALTLAGLPTDRFAFFGFLPAKAGAKASAIAEATSFRGTLAFYESGPRLAATLRALRDGLGEREAAVAREISKRFEQCVTGSLSALATTYADAPPKGEIVIVVGPPPAAEAAGEYEIDAASRREAMHNEVTILMELDMGCSLPEMSSNSDKRPHYFLSDAQQRSFLTGRVAGAPKEMAAGSWGSQRDGVVHA